MDALACVYILIGGLRCWLTAYSCFLDGGGTNIIPHKILYNFNIYSYALTSYIEDIQNSPVTNKIDTKQSGKNSTTIENELLLLGYKLCMHNCSKQSSRNQYGI